LRNEVMAGPEETGVMTVRDRRVLSPTGVVRRRRYSAEEKKAILAEASVPGARVSEISRRHGIGRSLIHNWRREEAASLLGATVRFTPVTVSPERPEPASASVVVRENAGRIEIELPDGVRVGLAGAVDEENLRCVLRALRR